MNILFYLIIFAMGITFGSFYTLAVYRIPKGQDITHTHSYCPNCKHKLGTLDLIPVFSYIFLGGKCRYCKEKIRPRYFILETLSGLVFVLMAFLLNLDIYSITITKVIDYAFFALYFTFIVLLAGIDQERRMIDRRVLNFGILLSVMYIIYLSIVDKPSLYIYIFYLIIYIVLLLIDSRKTKIERTNSYTISLIFLIIIMAIFTGEFITLNSIILTLLGIAIYIILEKLINKDKEKIYSNKISIGFLLSISNILYLIFSLFYLKIC